MQNKTADPQGVKLAAQAKLFKRFKGGDGRALIEFLELERSSLYDYMMRMTGQISRSFDSVGDVFQNVAEGEAKSGFDSVEELRTLLYVTGRKLNADIWNAETSRLLNLAIETPGDGAHPEVIDGQGASPKDMNAFRALDRSLRSLKGPDRELVLLRCLCHFEFEAMAEIASVSETDAEALFYKGMQRIDADCSGVVERPEAMLAKLPHHPPPEHSSQATMNLSVMMHDIKTKPAGLRSPFRLIFLVLFLVLALLFMRFPSKFYQFFGVATAPQSQPG